MPITAAEAYQAELRAQAMIARTENQVGFRSLAPLSQNPTKLGRRLWEQRPAGSTGTLSSYQALARRVIASTQAAQTATALPHGPIALSQIPRTALLESRTENFVYRVLLTTYDHTGKREQAVVEIFSGTQLSVAQIQADALNLYDWNDYGRPGRGAILAAQFAQHVDVPQVLSVARR